MTTIVLISSFFMFCNRNIEVWLSYQSINGFYVACGFLEIFWYYPGCITAGKCHVSPYSWQIIMTNSCSNVAAANVGNSVTWDTVSNRHNTSYSLVRLNDVGFGKLGCYLKRWEECQWDRWHWPGTGVGVQWGRLEPRALTLRQTQIHQSHQLLILLVTIWIHLIITLLWRSIWLVYRQTRIECPSGSVYKIVPLQNLKVPRDLVPRVRLTLSGGEQACSLWGCQEFPITQCNVCN